MLFRPDPTQFRMGDYWLFVEKGLVHQYYLKKHEGDRHNQRIGHATSRELLHWEEQTDITIAPQVGDWDYKEKIGRTGYTIAHDGRYWMAYGAGDAGTEKVGWLLSDDLYTWSRPSARPAMWPQGEYYERAETGTVEFGHYWRDPCFVKVGEVWEAFACARTADGAHGGRGCIGRARSQDLRHWEYLPPIYAPGRYRGMEVPHYCALGGYHYFFFSTMSRKGIRLNSPKGHLTQGVYYCVARNYEGPYVVPRDHLLSGENTYVGRHLAFDGQDLYTHLNQREWDERTDRPTFGLPKRFGQEADGALYLKYWPGAAGLWQGVDPLPLQGPLAQLGLPGEWQLEDQRLSGFSAYGPAAAWLPVECNDLSLTCTLALTPGSRASILVRGQENAGKLFTINDSEEQFEIGTFDGVRSGLYLHLLDNIPFAGIPRLREACGRRRFNVRLIARAEILEAYLDDVLVFTKSFQRTWPVGRIGCAVDTGRVELTDIAIHPMRPA